MSAGTNSTASTGTAGHRGARGRGQTLPTGAQDAATRAAKEREEAAAARTPLAATAAPIRYVTRAYATGPGSQREEEEDETGIPAGGTGALAPNSPRRQLALDQQQPQQNPAGMFVQGPMAVDSVLLVQEAAQRPQILQSTSRAAIDNFIAYMDRCAGTAGVTAITPWSVFIDSPTRRRLWCAAHGMGLLTEEELDDNGFDVQSPRGGSSTRVKAHQQGVNCDSFTDGAVLF